MELQYLKTHEIDKERWDETVRAAPNGSIYVFSWYLDAVCPGWEALVSGDYTRIMALTGRRKYGFQYLFQPLLNQQGGIVSIKPVTTEEVSLFIDSIPPSYKFAEITLNRFNPPPEGAIEVSMHTTYRLDLSSSYKILQGGYSENTRRNLKKAGSAGLSCQGGFQPVDFFGLFDEDSSRGTTILRKPRNREILHDLANILVSHLSGTIHGVRNRDGRLVAALLTGYSHHTHYYLVPVMNQEGRESKAMFHLVDRIIHDHSGKNEVLDFEGSDIENIARFYAGFGAQPARYPAIRFNRLPWPVNRLADRRRK